MLRTKARRPWCPALNLLIPLAAFVILSATPMRLHADRLVVDMLDGASETFEGVSIHSAELNPQNQLVLNVKPSPEAAAYPVELSRVISLEVGEVGEGRTYHLATPTRSGGRRVYENVTVLGYRDGQFRLVPEGSTQAFPLDGKAVIAMQPGDSHGSHPAFEAGPLPESIANFQDGNLGIDRPLQPNGQDFVMVDEGEEEVRDEGAGPEEMPRLDNFDEFLKFILDQAENDPRPVWVRKTATILQTLSFALSIATLVWCLVAVFMESKGDRWLIAILLIITFPCCCCAWVVKIWYAFARYELGARTWLRILVVLELLLVVAVWILNAIFMSSPLG